MYRPYPILARKGHSFQVQLLDYMKISNVFYVDRLRKYPNNLLLGQILPKEPAKEINSYLEWKV